ncbi:MAG: hypothetical protein V9E89_03810 [Ilumatobacteraceae bacterium]
MPRTTATLTATAASTRSTLLSPANPLTPTRAVIAAVANWAPPIRPMPTSARNRPSAALDRSSSGTSAMSSSPVCIAMNALVPAHSVVSSPITKTTALPVNRSGLWASWGPMIGMRWAVELRIRSRQCGRFWSRNPSTVVSTSISGNSERNPKWATSAAFFVVR